MLRVLFLRQAGCRSKITSGSGWTKILPAFSDDERYYSSRSDGGGGRGGNDKNQRQDRGGQPGGQRNSANGRSGNKGNLDRNLLQRAARGELGQKHDSGIPRLLARKPKAHLSPQSGRSNEGSRSKFFAREGSVPDWDEAEADLGGRKVFEALAKERVDENAAESDDEDIPQDYFSAKMIDDDKYYWREEEYESLSVLDLGDDETLEIGFGKEDMQTSNIMSIHDFRDVDALGDFDHEEDEPEKDSSNERSRSGGRVEPWQRMDPEEHFFFGQNDIFELVSAENASKDQSSPHSNFVMPLRDHGPELDDFLEAMTEHPTQYARIEGSNPHPDNKREPKPDFPRGRAHPPEAFVESFPRFIYVAGLPPLEVNGEAGDLDNPLHRSDLERMIADLVGVDSSQVFAANTTSGFVGLHSPREVAAVLSRGPTEKVVVKTPWVVKWTESEGAVEFGSVSPDCTVVVKGLPPGHTSSSLALSLFPDGTEVGGAYGGRSPGDIHFVTSSSVLVRFDSKEQAGSAVESQLVRDRLQELGRYSVQLMRARRELLHAGFNGVNRAFEKRKFGPRLVVDGDMPSRSFFLSHARVIHLRDLGTSVTKEAITEMFQPFCARRRDIEGSIEFVTCEEGLPTGKAYVGFDMPGEAEAAMRSLRGRLAIGDRNVVLRLVKDRRIPGQVVMRPEKRLERTETELLRDLHNWEQYVEQTDLEELERAGISRDVLDEALRSIRFSNPTFGAFDSSVPSENIEADKLPGEQYEELVKLYVQSLKECIATPDNVGMMYESIHFPDEQIDLSIFDKEKARQEELSKKRAL